MATSKKSEGKGDAGSETQQGIAVVCRANSIPNPDEYASGSLRPRLGDTYREQDVGTVDGVTATKCVIRVKTKAYADFVTGTKANKQGVKLRRPLARYPDVEPKTQ